MKQQEFSKEKYTIENVEKVPLTFSILSEFTDLDLCCMFHLFFPPPFFHFQASKSASNHLLSGNSSLLPQFCIPPFPIILIFDLGLFCALQSKVSQLSPDDHKSFLLTSFDSK